jgi:hypothetical protein
VKGGTIAGLGIVALLAAGCDAAEGVRVQELPSLERSSPEERAGLPLVAGEWRFAGWELQPADSAYLDGTLPSFGSIRLEVQRLDSIAGHYAVAGASFPLVGEVRRDGVVSLVAQAGEGGRYLAGRIGRDTLWVSTTTLLEPGSWPAGARAAFVREQVTATFARLEGQPTVLPGDTLPPQLAGPVESPEGEMPPTGEATTPAAPAQTGMPAQRPATTQPAATPAAPRAQPQQPRAAPPAATPPAAAPPAATPPAATPADPPREPAEPAEEPRRAPPRLLGEPVQRDSVPQ